MAILNGNNEILSVQADKEKKDDQRPKGSMGVRHRKAVIAT